MEKMAATTPARSNAEGTPKAPPPSFHPSLWGDFFLTYQPPTAPKVTGGTFLRTQNMAQNLQFTLTININP
jgi:hypothetical protein